MNATPHHPEQHDPDASGSSDPMVSLHRGTDELPLRRRGIPRHSHFTVNLTSLIDVTFLLLIYFIIATSMTAGEDMYRVDLPSREGEGAAMAADPFRLDDEPLRIAVQSTGLGENMYRLRLDGPYPQPETFEELFEFLSTRQVNEYAGVGGAGALFRREHPIVIAPTRHTRWDHAIEAFNTAARARYTNITFSKPG